MARYEGWDMESMKQVQAQLSAPGSDGDGLASELQTERNSTSSSQFTPANSNSTIPAWKAYMTPRTVIPEHTTSERQHHPAVAEYLGLGEDSKCWNRFGKARKPPRGNGNTSQTKQKSSKRKLAPSSQSTSEEQTTMEKLNAFQYHQSETAEQTQTMNSNEFDSVDLPYAHHEGAFSTSTGQTTDFDDRMHPYPEYSGTDYTDFAECGPVEYRPLLADDEAPLDPEVNKNLSDLGKDGPCFSGDAIHLSASTGQYGHCSPCSSATVQPDVYSDDCFDALTPTATALQEMDNLFDSVPSEFTLPSDIGTDYGQTNATQHLWYDHDANMGTDCGQIHTSEHHSNDSDDFNDGLNDDDLLNAFTDFPRQHTETEVPTDECDTIVGAGCCTDSTKSNYIPSVSTASSPGGFPPTLLHDSSAHDDRISKPFTTPLLLTTPRPRRTDEANNQGLKPIVRPPFASPVRDRSPIIGISSTTLLRTCFRVGEALNAGCGGVRNGKDVVIELYARVVSSRREPNSVKQHFVFGDLFHDRPPFINGVYELWKGVELWDYDSSRFLTPGKKICRCIGKMKREEKTWHMTILSIWEASWDDITYVQGIVCA